MNNSKINKSKSWSFENMHKIDKPLSRLIKKKRERTQINKIRNERGEIITETTEIQRIVRNCYMPRNLKTWAKWIHSWKHVIF